MEEKYFMNEKQTTSTPSEKPGMRGIKKKFYEKLTSSYKRAYI